VAASVESLRFALVLQALYNLSDDQAEYQLRDRFSFMLSRFD
jgi:IS5 family transposase